jgi:hypothetical protein
MNFFQTFCLDASCSIKGVQYFKPRYESQVYLVHYAKHKTLTRQEA